MKDIGKSVAVESAETLVEGIDRLIARRAELIAEYDRLGVILSEIRDKAENSDRKPKTGRFVRPRRKPAPIDHKTFAEKIADAMTPRPNDNDGGEE